MPMESSEIERLIKEAFPQAVVEINDLAGDGDHYAATVVAFVFLPLLPSTLYWKLQRKLQRKLNKH